MDCIKTFWGVPVLKFIQRLAYIYIFSIYLSVIFPGTFLQTLYRKF